MVTMRVVRGWRRPGTRPLPHALSCCLIDSCPVMSAAPTPSESATSESATNAPEDDLPETVGEAKAHPDFEKVGKFSSRHRDLQERYNEEAPLFFILDGPAWHVIAFSATTEAAGAPLKRLQ